MVNNEQNIRPSYVLKTEKGKELAISMSRSALVRHIERNPVAENTIIKPVK